MVLLRFLPRSAVISPLKFSKMSFSSEATAEVLFNSVGSKRVITLNRPKALNALNLNMVREIYPVLKEWDLSKDVDLVVIKGAGGKAFCAGGDVLAVSTSAKEARAGGASHMHYDFFKEEYTLNHLIGSMHKPYVALIDGIVMGGGCGLSINGKFRVATDKTMLAMPETALGLFPDVGGSYFLSRLKNNLGMYLAMTSYRLKGADTFHSGLATHYVNSSDLASLEEALLSLDGPNEKRVDEVIRSFEPKDIPEFSLQPHLASINDAFEAKSVEHILSKLEAQKTAWSKKQVETINGMSPTSLKITHKQLTDGARISFPKAFTMELRLSQRCVDGHDFHEGCRAILIDKDRNPKWNPATVAEVDDAKVEKFFDPLPGNKDLVLHEEH